MRSVDLNRLRAGVGRGFLIATQEAGLAPGVPYLSRPVFPIES